MRSIDPPATLRTGRAQRWTTDLESERLRVLRRQRGLSQFELSGLAGISLSTLSRLESQSGRPCRTRTLGRLARALDEDPAALLPGH